MANASGSSFLKATKMAITQPKGDEASDRSMSSYYEGVLIDEVLETHDDYDELAFPLKPVLDIIELIFRGATAEFPGVIQVWKGL